MNSAPPDLSSREGRRAYRRELRGVAARSRRTGLLILVIGVMIALLPIMGVHDLAGWSPQFLALIPFGLGCVLLVFAIVAGTRHHRRRMRPTPPPA